MAGSKTKLSQFSRSLWLTLGMFAVFSATFVDYVYWEKQIDRANELRQQSFLLTEELRQSSDDLTRMVRTYVVTGDTIYKQHYQEILDIRDGKKPRPVDYLSTYWDLVLPDGQRPLSLGSSVPLLELMRKAGFSEKELALLSEAKTNSDALTRTEFAAMALVESGNPPSATDRNKAIQMLFDAPYLQARALIMKPISQAYRMSDQRTQEAVHAAEVRALHMRLVFVLFGVLLVYLIWLARRNLHAVLGGALDDVYEGIAQLGRGNSVIAIRVAKGLEDSVLGWLSEAQKKLAKIEGERKRAEKQTKERMKELQAFFHLSAMAARKDFALDSLYQELANVLPESWQYPEIACARIVFGEREFRTANFEVSEWMQAAPIRVLGAVVGNIEVGYLEQKPGEDEGPFLKEERQLIDAIAERVGQITELKRAEEKLQQLAHYEMLTGLPNRTLFSDRLRQAIATAKRNKAHLALIFLDLDNFKPINDAFGHDVGDLLLKELAKRLLNCVRESDTVSRVGGDEFLLLLPTGEEHDALQVAEKILYAVTQPFELRGNSLHVSSSIGIAMYPDHGSEERVLIKNADMAMYRAKRSGRNNFQFFTEEMNIHASERLALENGLRRALRQSEFFLAYQPLMTMKTSRVIGVEALLRWRHPERGVILPEEFIAVAEESGLILPIGEWVLQTACRQLREWSQNAIPTFRIGINLSARQFRQRDLPGMVRRVMEDNRVSPSNLEIELTESTLMEDAEWAAEALQQLKNMGIRLSIDDFGTGYSSLRYLQQFPIDNLKIDAHFTRDLATNANDQAIATAIITMGHSMQMSVVAEGVETLPQLEFLRDRGCDVIQGYYVDKPLSPEKAAAVLTKAGHA